MPPLRCRRRAAVPHALPWEAIGPRSASSSILDRFGSMESPLQLLLREVEGQLLVQSAPESAASLAQAACDALQASPSAADVLLVLLQPGVQVRRPPPPPLAVRRSPLPSSLPFHTSPLLLLHPHTAGLCVRLRACSILQGEGHRGLSSGPVPPSGARRTVVAALPCLQQLPLL